MPIVVDGVRTYGSWTRPKWLVKRPPSKLIHNYYVNNQFEGRPDIISNQVYNTPHLWWVIVAFNNPLESLNWPRVGSIIQYPDESVVFPEL